MPKSHKVLIAGGVIAVVAMLVQPAIAERVAPTVERKLRGRLIVSTGPLSTAGQNPATAIKTITAAHQLALKAVKKDGGVSYYRFHWTAFLYKRPGVTSLSLEFYKQEAKNKFASSMSANKGLQGVDAAITILRGHTEISEDDGVTTGQTYKLKLVATIGGRDHLLAQTIVTFK